MSSPKRQKLTFKSSTFMDETIKTNVRGLRAWVKENKDMFVDGVTHALVTDLLNVMTKLPTQLPTETMPKVVVRYDYNNYRMGSFTALAVIEWKTYFAACLADATITFYEVLGKHSEISIDARKFEVEWEGESDISNIRGEHCERQWDEYEDTLEEYFEDLDSSQIDEEIHRLFDPPGGLWSIDTVEMIYAEEMVNESSPPYTFVD